MSIMRMEITSVTKSPNLLSIPNEYSRAALESRFTSNRI